MTETLDWRLHGLDLMTEHMATGDLPLMSASWMVGAQYKPSEIAKCEWGAIQQGPPWAVDSWGLGCLMQVSHDCIGKLEYTSSFSTKAFHHLFIYHYISVHRKTWACLKVFCKIA